MAKYVPPARRGHPQQSSSGDQEKSLGEIFGDLSLHTSNKEPTALFADIHDHYWAPPSDDGDGDSAPSPASLSTVMSHSTLNASALHRNKLQYIMVFKGANPRWASDGIIFVKSSLHLLPGYEQFKDAGSSSAISTGLCPSKNTTTQHSMLQEEETTASAAVDGKGYGEKEKVSETMTTEDEIDIHKVEPPAPLTGECQDDKLTNATNPRRDAEVTPTATHASSYSPNLSQHDPGPIAIFEQATKRQDGHFCFAGYHKITHLQYLPPQSADLYRMLEQKFSTIDRFGCWKQKTRSAASWNASMSVMWAVIKMERDEEANAELPPPRLTRLRAAEA